MNPHFTPSGPRYFPSLVLGDSVVDSSDDDDVVLHDSHVSWFPCIADHVSTSSHTVTATTTHDTTHDDNSDDDDDECVSHESGSSQRMAAPAVYHSKTSSRCAPDTDSDDESSTTASIMSCVSSSSYSSGDDARKPGPSCLKGSAAYRGIDRAGIRPQLTDDVERRTYVPHEPCGRPYADKPPKDCEAMLRRRPRRKHEQEERELDKQYLLASALNLAKCLSHSHGYAVQFGWPVEWSDEYATIFEPPYTGVVDHNYVSGKSKTGGACRILHRAEAIQALCKMWDYFHHVGTAPSDEERIASQSLGIQAGDLGLTPYNTPLLVEQGASSGVVAMPCPVEFGKPVKVGSWLMDSGTSLDLMDKRSVRSANRGFVDECDPIPLSTANGNTSADKCINLYVSKLDECITPIILDKTPNAMSLGDVL